MVILSVHEPTLKPQRCLIAPSNETTRHPGATLADIYDPDLMPPDLRRAHQAIDRAVDRLYRRSGFASERERVEHLFMLYERMRAPLAAMMQEKPKRRRARRKPPGARR